MKVTQKQIEYILLIVIVAIGIATYRFGYAAYTEKADAINKQNQEYSARVAELRVKNENIEDFQKGIDAAKEIAKDTLAKYGPGNTPEKTIMFVTGLESAADMTISSIAFNDDAVLYASEQLNDNGEPKITMSTTKANITYTTTYEGLKKCMDYINSYPERMNVENFTAVYNQETGGLSGAMIINLYSVADEDHKYEDPVVAGIPIGTDNIFGTVDFDMDSVLDYNPSNSESSSVVIEDDTPEDTTENTEANE